MNNTTQNNINLLQFEKLSEEGDIFHFISTRLGGVSSPPYESLNLGFHSKDENDNVLRNRIILSEQIGITLDSFTLAQQVHSGNVFVVSEEDKGKGAFSYSTGIPQTDGLITNIRGITLMVLVADCSPVLFFDRKNGAIGIAHSGRLGVANKIVFKMVEKMQQEYNCQPKNMLVGVGPSICGKHYPITKDKSIILRSSLKMNTRSIGMRNGEITFDLSTAINEQLLSAGIIGKHIETLKLCTYEEEKLFFSERRGGPPTGRFGAAIYLK